MNRLHIAYEAGCPFCRWARAYLEDQNTRVPLVFHPRVGGQSTAERAAGGLEGWAEHLLVVSETGLAYTAEEAWRILRWAVSAEAGGALSGPADALAWWDRQYHLATQAAEAGPAPSLVGGGSTEWSHA